MLTKLSEVFSTHTVTMEHLGKVAKVRETHLWATVTRNSREPAVLHHKMKKIQAL